MSDRASLMTKPDHSAAPALPSKSSRATAPCLPAGEGTAQGPFCRGALFWTAPDRASINRASRAAPKPCGAQVAQLVEHVTENHGVGGSIPPLGTKEINDLEPVAEERRENMRTGEKVSM
jgi:hypothetical protein